MASITDGIPGVLLKCTGIALVAELAELVCKDAGCASLGQMIRILTGAVIGYLAIPVVKALLDLVCEILGML